MLVEIEDFSRRQRGRHDHGPCNYFLKRVLENIEKT
jgi:hypothetical protein